MEFRNLDGYYFRVERNGEWQNICFSDLKQYEREKVLANKSEDFLKSLCYGLGEQLRFVGDTANLHFE